MSRFSTLILLAPSILLALTVHEFAHGYIAWRLGDPTAKNMGRLTLNPLAHLDPIGTILLFIVYFGWAKPVPVNPLNLRRPRRDMIWVALAGPASNVVLALALGILLQLLIQTGAVRQYSPLYSMVAFGVFINLMLAFFNLIPIPPLDGSKIVGGLLPVRFLDAWHSFERIGWLVLIGIIIFDRYTGVSLFGETIFPLAQGFYNLFTASAPLTL